MSKNEVALCSQCRARPAMFPVEGHLLCLQCYTTLQEIQARQQEANMRMQNFLIGQMEAITGLPGSLPRYEFPSQSIQLQPGPMTFNHFNISESKIGVINTGEVHRIDVAMGSIQQGGAAELATALRDFTQANIDTGELSPTQKGELLEQVAEVSEQTALPPEKRKKGIFKALLAGIKETASTVGSLAKAWSHLQPMLEGILS